MAKQTTVPLSEPITGHEGKITRVVLREPTATEYFDLGEPVVYAHSQAGMFFTSEKEDTIRQYINRCTVEPKEALLLEQLCLADGIKVKEAMMDFFQAARQTSASKTSATSSSSASAS